METLKCMEARRSIRQFAAQPVDEKTVEALIHAASLAPSWKNSQTVRYYALTGEKKAAFAMDCRKLTDIIQKQAARPASVTFFYDGTAGNAEEDLNSGSVKTGCSYTLTLNGEVQLDWSADRMAQQTEATALLEEENDSFAEYEAAEGEAAD